MDKKHVLFYILVSAIILGIVAPNLFSDGMILDGLFYATISKNLANGLGSFWYPHLTNTLMPQFHEPILFTTPVKVSRGLPPYNLNCLQMMVVTPYRIIFAPFMPDTLSRVKAQAVAEAKQEGKGFFGRMSVSMKSDTRFYDTYRTKSLESIFLEHQNCYQIQNSWVQKVKFWKSRAVSDADGYGETYNAVIMLIVNQVEIVITAERLDQDKEMEQFLSSQFSVVFQKMRK